MRAVLDTSVFIARERDRPLRRLPEEVAVSVVTLSELRHGVLAAVDHETRAIRLRTLETAHRLRPALVLDERVGDELARLGVVLGAAGKAMRIMDAWIGAVALANDAAVCTQDADFDVLEEVGLLEVVRV